MRWIKPNLRNSIYSLLGGNPAPVTESVIESRTEDIRQAMLDAIGEAGPTHYPTVTRKVRFAADIQALWYLRGDLMAVLSATEGEVAARDRVDTISTMFEGLLPQGLSGRRARVAT